MAMEFDLDTWIALALKEDLGKEGDISTLASIPAAQWGRAQLWAKEAGCFAGQVPFEKVFRFLHPEAKCTWLVQDGSRVEAGTLVAEVEGPVHTLLSGERLALNIVQRMSAIATQTQQWVALAGSGRTRLLDTRKTTPMFRYFEKEAVRIGGGVNHRFGLYDMVMLKDNHIDAAGGITLAVTRTQAWLGAQGLERKIEVETRNLAEVQEALACKGIHRIMFDNFSPELIREALILVNGQVETEASGGIHGGNLADYAATGVDFISLGALTHSVKNMDFSLKIRKA
jgi:nicotinate-nucleotide pyrophosphorylase (carboxylating)